MRLFIPDLPSWASSRPLWDFFFDSFLYSDGEEASRAKVTAYGINYW